MNTARKRRRFFRRTAALLAAVIMLAACFAGCANPAGSAPGDEATAAPEATLAPVETDVPAPTEEPMPEVTPFPDDGFTRIERVGTVPEKYKGIVKQDNMILSIVVCSDMLIRTDRILAGETVDTETVHVYDIYFNEIAQYAVNVEDRHAVSFTKRTSDGGFLIVYGYFSSRIEDGTMADVSGMTSYVIKCDRNGSEEFKAELFDIPRSAFEHCIEQDGNYYFFGDTSEQGEYSESDLSALILSGTGEKLLHREFGGSSAESLYVAEARDGGFMLKVSSDSTDGIFKDADRSTGSFDISVDSELNVQSVDKCDSVFDFLTSHAAVGCRGEEVIYRQDLLDSGFDAGTPWKLIDYGSEYLVISLNLIGEVDTNPIYSGRANKLEVYEEVYTMYDADGNLLFREAYDYNTPAMLRELYPEQYERLFG